MICDGLITASTPSVPTSGMKPGILTSATACLAPVRLASSAEDIDLIILGHRHESLGAADTRLTQDSTVKRVTIDIAFCNSSARARARRRAADDLNCGILEIAADLWASIWLMLPPPAIPPACLWFLMTKTGHCSVQCPASQRNKRDRLSAWIQCQNVDHHLAIADDRQHGDHQIGKDWSDGAANIAMGLSSVNSATRFILPSHISFTSKAPGTRS